MYKQRSIAYSKTRSIYDLSDGLEEGYDDCIMVCVTRLGWRIARSLLVDYTQRAVAFASQYEDTYYVNLNEPTWDVVQDMVARTLGACEMTCSEIVTALDGIAAAVSSTQIFCGGSAGSGVTSQPADPFDDTGSNFPDTFDDRPEYLAWKCKRANIIISGWKFDLEFMEELELAQFATAVLVAGMLTPIPFDDIAAILGLLLTYFIEGTLDGYLSEMISYIDDNDQRLVCMMYSGSSATEVKADLTQDFANELSIPAAVLMQFFADFTNVNSLFAESAILGNLPDTFNLSCDPECDTPECNFIVTSKGLDGGPGVYIGEFDGSLYQVNGTFNVTDALDICDDSPDVLFILLSGTVFYSAGGQFGWRLRHTGETHLDQFYNSNTPPPGCQPEVRECFIWSTTPFTVRITECTV